jgi:heme/copper-type cytochrome/quinol oxidase subunit 2
MQQDEYLANKILARAREVSALTDRQKETFCRGFLESTISGRLDMVVPEPFDLVQIPLEETETVVAVTASSTGWRYNLTHEQAALEDIKEQIYLPVGEKIRFVVQSVDVIHSMKFEDSQYGTIDAIPGVKKQRNVVFDRAGVVTVRCGEPHAQSDREFIKINVVERERFSKWLRSGR